jgi:hypothetical protein
VFEYFGWSVSLSSDGSRLAIGGGENGGGEEVRVYSINNPCNSNACITVSIPGCTDPTASNYDAEATEDDGSCCYAEWGDEWVQLGQDIDGEAANDESGYSVSLSSDGSIVAIGAGNNDGKGTDSGHVRVLKYDDVKDAWIQMGDDIDGENAYDYSGYSVSLSSDGSTHP